MIDLFINGFEQRKVLVLNDNIFIQIGNETRKVVQYNRVHTLYPYTMPVMWHTYWEDKFVSNIHPKNFSEKEKRKLKSLKSKISLETLIAEFYEQQTLSRDEAEKRIKDITFNFGIPDTFSLQNINMSYTYHSWVATYCKSKNSVFYIGRNHSDPGFFSTPEALGPIVFFEENVFQICIDVFTGKLTYLYFSDNTNFSVSDRGMPYEKAENIADRQLNRIINSDEYWVKAWELFDKENQFSLSKAEKQIIRPVNLKLFDNLYAYNYDKIMYKALFNSGFRKQNVWMFQYKHYMLKDLIITDGDDIPRRVHMNMSLDIIEKTYRAPGDIKIYINSESGEIVNTLLDDVPLKDFLRFSKKGKY